MDRDAASKISTTCKPVSPSEIGDCTAVKALNEVLGFRLQRLLGRQCGAHISPARYPILS